MTGLTRLLAGEAPSSRVEAAFLRTTGLAQSFLRSPLGAAGLAILGVLVLAAVFAPVLAPFAPDAQDLAARLLPPNGEHLLGSDELGRDILSRILFGSRITLEIVALVAIIAAPVGLLVGASAGYAGGLLDSILMRVTDVFLAFPKLVLALALVAALGPGLENAILAIAATSWPAYARIARAETLAVRRADFIAAARMSGASGPRILLVHVAPLCLSSVVVRLTLDMAGIILTAAGLGFLGLGARPPAPEWGTMMSSGREFLTDHWWVATMPGIAIFLVSLAFNLVGDALRDALDPRAARR
jgi:peptide/nickel transport system permease protein